MNLLHDNLRLVQILRRRGSLFQAVAWSPDSLKIAAASEDGLIRVWSAKSQEIVQILRGHSGPVVALAWAIDGRIASGSDDMTVKVWNPDSGICTRTLESHALGVSAVAWSRDGRLASGSHDRTVKIWSPEDGKCLRTLEADPFDVLSVAWSAGGRVASGGTAGAKVWLPESGECLRELHNREESEWTWATAVSWSEDEQLATASGRALQVWSPDFAHMCVLEGHTDIVRSLAWTSGGILASGGDDRTVRVWSVSSRRCLKTFTGHFKYVTAVAWSPRGELASASFDRTVRVRSNAGAPSRVLVGRKLEAESAVISPDGAIVAAGLSKGSISLLRMESGKFIGKCEGGHRDRVRALAWSTDGRLASGSDDETVRVWQAESRVCLEVLKGHTDAVVDVAWAADGTLASASHDSTVRIWVPGSGQRSQVLKGHTNWVTCVAWSASGQLASGSHDNTVRVWPVNTGSAVQVLEGHDSWVEAVSWSSDGRLASGSHDRTVRVWDLATGQAKFVLEGHRTEVTSLQWTLDAAILVSTSDDGEVRVWNANTGTLLSVIKAPSESKYRASGLAIIADATVPSSVLSDAVVLRSWKVLLPQKVEQVRISTAKIVLVGESNVGKSGLARRLAEDRFEHTDTTHGMKVWRVPVSQPADKSRKELFLWDMGGQPEYRLIHQLFLHDTASAMFLFHPTRGARAFEEIEEWNRRLEKQLSGRSACKLLVRSKTDVETGPADLNRIADFQKTHGFAAYFEVSSCTGAGIPELRKALVEKTDWQK